MSTSAIDPETAGETRVAEKVPQPGSQFQGARTGKRRRILLIVASLVVVSLVATVLFVMRKPGSRGGRPVPAPSFDVAESSPQPLAGTKARPGEIVITLSQEELESAQIKTEVAVAQSTAGASAEMAGGLRTTGIVQANQYKEVPVMPVAGGIVKEVSAALGDKVRRGQLLATVFSNELADVQSEYLKMSAEVEEHHQHHRRTIELVEIGAASREELEQAISAYKRAQASLATVRQRLLLFGMSEKDIESLRASGAVSSTISISAPSSGTIISRAVNPGEVISMGKELFRIADLSTVWVVGQVYENSFAEVGIGSLAAITTGAYPGRTFNGKVSYIEPAVNPQSRTAQVRVEVVNPGEILKFGMFVDVRFGGSAQSASASGMVVAVPRAAVQIIGARQVVYVATDQPGAFVQREITAGTEINGMVAITAGVIAGERVVTEGSFLLRAESLKLNPEQSSAPPQPGNTSPGLPLKPDENKKANSTARAESGTQSVRVMLTDKGFQPETITLKRGVMARITFVRQVEVTCATEVRIPDFGIKRTLPLNEPVVIELAPEKAGKFAFSCPMNMVRGKIVVK